MASTCLDMENRLNLHATIDFGEDPSFTAFAGFLGLHLTGLVRLLVELMATTVVPLTKRDSPSAVRQAVRSPWC